MDNETCEDRNYECCDENPPGKFGYDVTMTDEEYEIYYERHLTNVDQEGMI